VERLRGLVGDRERVQSAVRESRMRKIPVIHLDADCHCPSCMIEVCMAVFEAVEVDMTFNHGGQSPLKSSQTGRKILMRNISRRNAHMRHLHYQEKGKEHIRLVAADPAPIFLIASPTSLAIF